MGVEVRMEVMEDMIDKRRKKGKGEKEWER